MKDLSMKDTIQTDFVLSGKFKHQPPEGYWYETRKHSRTIISIWVHCQRRFIYNGGSPTSSIWGFYNTKTQEFHAPINSKTIGDVVDINTTTPYSAMQLNLNPLMQCLMSLK